MTCVFRSQDSRMGNSLKRCWMSKVPPDQLRLGKTGQKLINHTIPTPFAFSIDVSFQDWQLRIEFLNKKAKQLQICLPTNQGSPDISGKPFQHQYPEIIQATIPHGSFKESGSTGASAYSERKDFKTRKIVDLGVSKNNGTPKSSISMGFSIINHPFWGTIIFGLTPIYIQHWQSISGWKNFYLTDFVLEGIQLTSTQNTGVQPNDSAEGM